MERKERLEYIICFIFTCAGGRSAGQGTRRDSSECAVLSSIFSLPSFPLFHPLPADRSIAMPETFSPLPSSLSLFLPLFFSFPLSFFYSQCLFVLNLLPILISPLLFLSSDFSDCSHVQVVVLDGRSSGTSAGARRARDYHQRQPRVHEYRRPLSLRQ